jgi:hypothetical protein
MPETQPKAARAHPTEQKLAKPFFQFGLRELLLLPVAAAAFLGITMGFGQFAIMALPMVVVAFGLTLVVGRLIGLRLNIAEGLIVCALMYLLLSCAASGAVDPRGPVREMQCRNKLKCIGLALHNYHEVYGCFPPAHVADESGRPAHSWRVLILPFLEQQALYEQYDFEEPWDGPNNSRLAGVRVEAYCCPEEDGSARTTSYVAVVGPATVWPGKEPVKISDITDGTSDTLIVVEIANSGIHWMEPKDLDLSTTTLGVNPPQGPAISSAHPRDKWDRPSSQTANVLLVDGSVHVLTRQVSSEDLRALLTIAGREKIDRDKLGW